MSRVKLQPVIAVIKSLIAFNYTRWPIKYADRKKGSHEKKESMSEKSVTERRSI